LMFRAMTTDKALMPQLAAAGDALHDSVRRLVIPDGG
jgi:hypothetical protein